jgi:uncharacterized protein (TIGR04222 family)
MFPFNLPGPQFLLFYAVFGAAVVAALYFLRRHVESGPPPPIAPQDPYLFACLRGGPKEVVCIATLGLVDRGLLRMDGNVISRQANVRPEISRRRIEQEVLRYFEDKAELFSILKRHSVLSVAADEYEYELRHHRLIPDAAIDGTRTYLMGAAIAIVVAVGGMKLMVALGAGRANIWFLVIMMIVWMGVIWKITHPYRTATGDSVLASARGMFGGLRERVSSIRPGSGSRELLWLTSLFGVTALPAAAFPFVQHFRPKPNAGSGCGSCCGGGGGGGGGCGGGGGGCGGCGS